MCARKVACVHVASEARTGQLLKRLSVGSFLVAVLTSCVQAPGGSGISSSSPVEARSTPGLAAVGSGTISGPADNGSALPSGISPAIPGQTSILTPTGTVTLTRAQAGSTISIVVGQQVLVELGSEFDWQITVSDTRLLALAPDSGLAQGAQGLFVGRGAGRATLSVVGEPPCRKATPACMVDSVAFGVTILVRAV